MWWRNSTSPGSPCDQVFGVRLNLSGGDGAGGGIAAPVLPATENCRIITLLRTPNAFTEADFFMQNTGLHFQLSDSTNTVCVGGVFDCCPCETET